MSVAHLRNVGGEGGGAIHGAPEGVFPAIRSDDFRVDARHRSVGQAGADRQSAAIGRNEGGTAGREG